MAQFGFTVLLMGLFGAGLAWFIIWVGRADFPKNPKASAERLAEAEHVQRDLKRFGPTWIRFSLGAALFGAIVWLIGLIV